MTAGTADALADVERVVRVPAARDDLRSAAADGADAETTVASVGPTGIGALDPLVTATADGRTAFYVDPSTDRVEAAAAVLGDGSHDGTPDAVVDHEPGRSTMPTAALPGLGSGARRLLGGCGWRRPASAADHDAAGGFVDADAEMIREAASDLLGRGWGDWQRDRPVTEAWSTAGGTADADPVVVANTHGGAADALLAESAPFELLEGAALAARATDAGEAVVYLSEADEAAAEAVRAAVEAYPDPPVALTVATGPAVYRAAEPTMALEAIEGADRLEARLRRPDALPTLHGHPAVVHSARTLGHLGVAVRADESPSTRTVTVAGDVSAPATVEIADSDALEAAFDAVEVTGEFGAASVGNRFGGLTRSLDVAVDPESLAGADLGTDGRVEVLAEDRCSLAFVGRRTAFAADANCGRCVPCREGTTQLADMLRDAYEGDYDEGKIAELTRVMAGTSTCAFGVDAARPVRTLVERFDGELAAHADGRCPAGECFEGGADAESTAAGASERTGETARADGAGRTDASGTTGESGATRPGVPR